MEGATFENDHHPEIVEAGKATKRLERLGLQEILHTPEARRNFFGTLTNEQYKKMLGYINSISRGQPIRYEYEDGQLPMEPTPSLQDKEYLMDETFQTIKSILNNDAIETNEALRLAGLTLAGAANYIHAYENGNGRTGRIMHYLMEYGNQRGKKALEEELSAIISKLPLYDTDKAQAIHDGPPPEMGDALMKLSYEKYKKELSDTDARVAATKRAQLFLEMMRGDITVPINREVVLRNFALAQKEESDIGPERIPAGKIDGRELYIKSYLYNSSIPNREPGDIPEGAKRLIGQRKPETLETLIVNMDLV